MTRLFIVFITTVAGVLVARKFLDSTKGNRMATKKTGFRKPKPDRLAYELHELRHAIDRQTRNQGKWLGLIAEAIALMGDVGPDDDPRIADLAARMKASNDDLQMAIDAVQGVEPD